jgi:hypothetical protein
VLVVTRFTVPAATARVFLERAKIALATLAAHPGYLRGRIGRASDDPERWVITTEWAGVGAYRRAIGSYEGKLSAAPLLSEAHDEPSAYEIIYAQGDGEAVERPSDRAVDAGTVGLGEAAGPEVASDL